MNAAQQKKRLQRALDDVRGRLDEVEEAIEQGNLEEALDLLAGTVPDELDTLLRRVRAAHA